VVVDGVMYITGPERGVCARRKPRAARYWSFARAHACLPARAAAAPNRGRRAFRKPGISQSRTNAHLLALDRATGRKLWMSPWWGHKDGYSSTAASAGDRRLCGLRHLRRRGRRARLCGCLSGRHRRARLALLTIRCRRERLGDVVGKRSRNTVWHHLGHRSYDAALGLLYWTTGNPAPTSTR